MALFEKQLVRFTKRHLIVFSVVLALLTMLAIFQFVLIFFNLENTFTLTLVVYNLPRTIVNILSWILVAIVLGLTIFVWWYLIKSYKNFTIMRVSWRPWSVFLVVSLIIFLVPNVLALNFIIPIFGLALCLIYETNL